MYIFHAYSMYDSDPVWGSHRSRPLYGSKAVNEPRLPAPKQSILESLFMSMFPQFSSNISLYVEIFQMWSPVRPSTAKTAATSKNIIKFMSLEMKAKVYTKKCIEGTSLKLTAQDINKSTDSDTNL